MNSEQRSAAAGFAGAILGGLLFTGIMVLVLYLLTKPYLNQAQGILTQGQRILDKIQQNGILKFFVGGN